ncbi:hypothetical protein [Massilia orientalis]|uniref:Uncharacterized protein n=1 Tax=Massilia orientalis TaxID=3050128 RepID=A0ACC7MK75_9BURK|nr:hypothetical protein [Massilia sp. YIM B02787]
MKSIPKIARIDIAVAVVSGVLVACITGAMVSDLAAGALGCVVAFLTMTGHQRQRAALQARIDNPAALHWEVVVNDVLVGTLADAHYAALETAVLDDWRLYLAQARNFAEVCSRAGGKFLFAVPVTLFWLGIAVVAFDPHSAVAVIDAVRTTPSTEIISAFGPIVRSLVAIVAVPMGVYALLAAPSFGYENQFQAELGAAVRRRVQAAAAGRMLLVPVQALRTA